MIEYLSHTPQWREMAVFVTEDDAQGGVDHIDAHRTVLLAVGHTAAGTTPPTRTPVFQDCSKRFPPAGHAAAKSVRCGSVGPERRVRRTSRISRRKVLPADPRLFDPAKAKEPLDPKPSPRMDDPREVK